MSRKYSPGDSHRIIDVVVNEKAPLDGGAFCLAGGATGVSEPQAQLGADRFLSPAIAFFESLFLIAKKRQQFLVLAIKIRQVRLTLIQPLVFER